MLKTNTSLCVAALILIPLIYWQGLGGLFLLDDVANLQLLANTINEEGFWAGVMGGNSGPTGRPVSLWTLALQQSSWPDDPASFKLVNVFIHLINSVLMALIVYWLLPHLFSNINQYRFTMAILLSAFWALLPIQISTVLYVVQRMVLLSSLFMLLAILFYIWARAELCLQKFTRAGIIFCLGVGISSLLAILSKESGLLVFAFLLTIEILVQPKQPIPNARIRFWLIVVLAVPLILFVAYIINKELYHHYEGRTFNLTERVLTQPRVLLDYVHQIILPVQSELGLYHDDYLKSKSWLNPISTLWAIVIWIAFSVLAIWGKNANKPWLFFAFFWFMSGHLMESTLLPLELYFEHRNYLSSMGVLVGCTGVLIAAYSAIKSESIQNIVRISVIIYPCLILSITFSHIGLWGDKAEYMVVSAKENPHSLRARMLMIDYYDAIGDISAANEEVALIAEDFPEEIAIKISRLDYACKNDLDISKINIPKDSLRNGRFSHATESSILKIIDMKREGKCDQISYTYLLDLVNEILENKNYEHVKTRFVKVKSVLFFLLRDYVNAIRMAEAMEYREFSDNLGLVTLYILNRDYEKASDLYFLMDASENLSNIERKKLAEIKIEIDKAIENERKN